MTDIWQWAKTAASNTASSPDGFPEGMRPGDFNNAAREVMAAFARYVRRDGGPGWIKFYDYTSTDTITITLSGTNVFEFGGGNATDIYALGQRVRVSQSRTGTASQVLYGTIYSTTYSSSVNSIYINWDHGLTGQSLTTGQVIDLTIPIVAGRDSGAKALPVKWGQIPIVTMSSGAVPSSIGLSNTANYRVPNALAAGGFNPHIFGLKTNSITNTGTVYFNYRSALHRVYLPNGENIAAGTWPVNRIVLLSGVSSSYVLLSPPVPVYTSTKFPETETRRPYGNVTQIVPHDSYANVIVGGDADSNPRYRLGSATATYHITHPDYSTRIVRDTHLDNVKLTGIWDGIIKTTADQDTGQLVTDEGILLRKCLRIESQTVGFSANSNAHIGLLFPIEGSAGGYNLVNSIYGHTIRFFMRSSTPGRFYLWISPNTATTSSQFTRRGVHFDISNTGTWTKVSQAFSPTHSSSALFAVSNTIGCVIWVNWHCGSSGSNDLTNTYSYIPNWYGDTATAAKMSVGDYVDIAKVEAYKGTAYHPWSMRTPAQEDWLMSRYIRRLYGRVTFYNSLYKTTRQLMPSMRTPISVSSCLSTTLSITLAVTERTDANRGVYALDFEFQHGYTNTWAFAAYNTVIDGEMDP